MKGLKGTEGAEGGALLHFLPAQAPGATVPIEYTSAPPTVRLRDPFCRPGLE